MPDLDAIEVALTVWFVVMWAWVLWLVFTAKPDPEDQDRPNGH